MLKSLWIDYLVCFDSVSYRGEKSYPFVVVWVSLLPPSSSHYFFEIRCWLISSKFKTGIKVSKKLISYLLSGKKY